MSDGINTEELDQDMKVDWTVDPVTGRSNSSPEFMELTKEVGNLIRSEAHSIVRGRTDLVGRLIMAQLAHVHGLAPANVRVQEATADEPGNLSGIFEWNGQLFRFQAASLVLEAPTES